MIIHDLPRSRTVLVILSQTYLMAHSRSDSVRPLRFSPIDRPTSTI